MDKPDYDLCSCEDCGWKGDISEANAISDIDERVFANEIMPAGECPECGSLVHTTLDPPWSIGGRYMELKQAAKALLEVMESPRSRKASDAWDKLRELAKD